MTGDDHIPARPHYHELDLPDGPQRIYLATSTTTASPPRRPRSGDRYASARRTTSPVEAPSATNASPCTEPPTTSRAR
jgi:hypothetical protein